MEASSCGCIGAVVGWVCVVVGWCVDGVGGVRWCVILCFACLSQSFPTFYSRAHDRMYGSHTVCLFSRFTTRTCSKQLSILTHAQGAYPRLDPNLRPPVLSKMSPNEPRDSRPRSRTTPHPPCLPLRSTPSCPRLHHGNSRSHLWCCCLCHLLHEA